MEWFNMRHRFQPAVEEMSPWQTFRVMILKYIMNKDFVPEKTDENTPGFPLSWNKEITPITHEFSWRHHREVNVVLTLSYYVPTTNLPNRSQSQLFVVQMLRPQSAQVTCRCFRDDEIPSLNYPFTSEMCEKTKEFYKSLDEFFQLNWEPEEGSTIVEIMPKFKKCKNFRFKVIV